LTYFNIVKLKAGEHFDYRIAGMRPALCPATGTVTVETGGETFADIGNRGADVWDGEPRRRLRAHRYRLRASPR
jgi:5-deoxy-glucuronate isomerase